MYNIYKVTHRNIRDGLNQNFTKAVAGFAPAGALLGYECSGTCLGLQIQPCLTCVLIKSRVE